MFSSAVMASGHVVTVMRQLKGKERTIVSFNFQRIPSFVFYQRPHVTRPQLHNAVIRGEPIECECNWCQPLDRQVTYSVTFTVHFVHQLTIQCTALQCCDKQERLGQAHWRVCHPL